MTTKDVIAYSIASLAGGCLMVVFNTFHVELFLQIYHLDASLFATGHILYLVWNTLNDLLSGFWSDSIAQLVGGRIYLIRYGGYLWVISFLIPWFSVHVPEQWYQFFVMGHFLISLSLIDAMFSLVC